MTSMELEELKARYEASFALMREWAPRSDGGFQGGDSYDHFFIDLMTYEQSIRDLVIGTTLIMLRDSIVTALNPDEPPWVKNGSARR